MYKFPQGLRSRRLVEQKYQEKREDATAHLAHIKDGPVKLSNNVFKDWWAR